MQAKRREAPRGPSMQGRRLFEPECIGEYSTARKASRTPQWWPTASRSRFRLLLLRLSGIGRNAPPHPGRPLRAGRALEGTQRERSRGARIGLGYGCAPACPGRHPAGGWLSGATTLWPRATRQGAFASVYGPRFSPASGACPAWYRSFPRREVGRSGGASGRSDSAPMSWATRLGFSGIRTMRAWL